jgi:hypothetical protein
MKRFPIIPDSAVAHCTTISTVQYSTGTVLRQDFNLQQSVVDPDVHMYRITGQLSMSLSDLDYLKT